MAPSTPSTPRTPRSTSSSRHSSPTTAPNTPECCFPTRSPKSPAGIQKRTKGATNFPLLTKLPLELQDEIWKQALDMHAPNVYGVQLKKIQQEPAANETDTASEEGAEEGPRVEMINEFLWMFEAGAPKPDIYPIEKGLRETCARSDAIVALEKGNWQPLVPYELKASRSYVATEMVDLASDLFVLSHEWEGEIGPEEVIPGVSYVGVTWEGPWDRRLAQKMDKAVRQFPDLKSLYVIVSANHKAPVHLKPWNERTMPYLETYMAGYQETAEEKTTISFQAQDVVYEEIPIQELYNMGLVNMPMKVISEHLKPQLEDLEEGEIFQGPAVRMMTWSNSRRVRGRFPW
ncbi:hypothetical protein ACHAPT_001486 [Fusarium lateritium]